MTLENYIQFIKAHEKLIIIVLACFLLYRTGQGIENAWIRHDDKIATQAATAVTADTATNKQLSDQLAQVKTQQQAQNLQLTADITAKLAALQAQQKRDQLATQQQIIDRWKLLQPMQPGALQASGQNDVITPQAAAETVQQLEQIPVLKSEIQDQSQQITNDALVIVRQSDLIAGLNVQIVDEKKSHTADMNLEKAKSKRSWLRGFKWGLVVGAVGTEAVRVWAGHP
jgi:ABC-type nickel/cobalt efflux system permease component RcnA